MRLRVTLSRISSFACAVAHCSQYALSRPAKRKWRRIDSSKVAAPGNQPPAHCDTVTQLMLLTNVSFVMANTAHRIGAPTIALAEDRKGISHDE